MMAIGKATALQLFSVCLTRFKAARKDWDHIFRAEDLVFDVDVLLINIIN